MEQGQLIPEERQPKPKKDDYKPTVPNGTTLQIAVSAMIKEMRRGRELEALYWARQIEGRFHKYVWRRLAIFAAEDVGLGDPMAPVVIRSLWESYDQIREDSQRKNVDGNLLAMAVLYLSRAAKSREGDYLWGMIDLLMGEGWQPEVPDYAVDAHTTEGRERWSDPVEKERMWFTVWSAVTNRSGPQDYLEWHLRRLAAQGKMSEDEVEKYLAGLPAERHVEPGSLPEVDL